METREKDGLVNKVFVSLFARAKSGKLRVKPSEKNDLDGRNSLSGFLEKDGA